MGQAPNPAEIPEKVQQAPPLKVPTLLRYPKSLEKIEITQRWWKNLNALQLPNPNVPKIQVVAEGVTLRKATPKGGPTSQVAAGPRKKHSLGPGAALGALETFLGYDDSGLVVLDGPGARGQATRLLGHVGWLLGR